MKVSRQCVARSKQANRRCQRAAILGGTVCRVHGGSAPQVKQAAADRLAELVDPAIHALEDALTQRQHWPALISAVKDVLDRAGLRPTESLVIDDHRSEWRELDAAAFAERLRKMTNAAYELADKEQHRLEGKTHHDSNQHK
ncbi:MAG TPA: hypothetical protein VNJ02_16310 [Vicinamibacterales bacterium]|nr:hypothetical protein [Vicinamibacterales bacterium]